MHNSAVQMLACTSDLRRHAAQPDASWASELVLRIVVNTHASITASQQLALADLTGLYIEGFKGKKLLRRLSAVVRALEEGNKRQFADGRAWALEFDKMEEHVGLPLGEQFYDVYELLLMRLASQISRLAACLAALVAGDDMPEFSDRPLLFMNATKRARLTPDSVPEARRSSQPAPERLPPLPPSQRSSSRRPSLSLVPPPSPLAVSEDDSAAHDDQAPMMIECEEADYPRTPSPSAPVHSVDLPANFKATLPVESKPHGAETALPMASHGTPGDVAPVLAPLGPVAQAVAGEAKAAKD